MDEDDTKDFKVILAKLGFPEQVIDIVFDSLMDEVMKYIRHHTLVCGTYFPQVEGHDTITVSSPRGDKGSFVLILWGNQDLVVS